MSVSLWSPLTGTFHIKDLQGSGPRDNRTCDAKEVAEAIGVINKCCKCGVHLVVDLVACSGIGKG